MKRASLTRRLFTQRIRSKEGPYNVTEVTEIASQLQPHLKFDTLDALFSREICCVIIVVSLIRFSGDLEGRGYPGKFWIGVCREGS